MLKLRLLTGPRAGRQLRVSDTKPVSIGRRLGRLRLHDSRVSKHHAEITFEHGAWVLRDLGSSNGTFVNRDEIDAMAELETDDLIQIGRVLIKVLRADEIGMDVLPGVPISPADDPLNAEELAGTRSSEIELDDVDLDLLLGGGTQSEDDAIDGFLDDGDEGAAGSGSGLDLPKPQGQDEQDASAALGTSDDPFGVGDEPDAVGMSDDAGGTGPGDDGGNDGGDLITIADEQSEKPTPGTTVLSAIDPGKDAVSTDQTPGKDPPDAVDETIDEDEDASPQLVGLSLGQAPPQQPEADTVDDTEIAQPLLDPPADAGGLTAGIQADPDPEPPCTESGPQDAAAPIDQSDPADTLEPAVVEGLDEEADPFDSVSLDKADREMADAFDQAAADSAVGLEADASQQAAEEAGLVGDALSAKQSDDGPVSEADGAHGRGDTPAQDKVIAGEDAGAEDVEAQDTEAQQQGSQATAPADADDLSPLKETQDAPPVEPEACGPELEPEPESVLGHSDHDTSGFDIDAAFEALSEGLDDSFELPAIDAEQAGRHAEQAAPLAGTDEEGGLDGAPQAVSDDPTGNAAVPEGAEPSADALAGSQLDVGFIQDALAKLEAHGPDAVSDDVLDAEPDVCEAGEGVLCPPPENGPEPLTSEGFSPEASMAAERVDTDLPPAAAPALTNPPPGINPTSMRDGGYEERKPKHKRGRWFFSRVFLLIAAVFGVYFLVNEWTRPQITGRPGLDPPAGQGQPSGAQAVRSPALTPDPPSVTPGEVAVAPPRQRPAERVYASVPNPFAAGPAITGGNALRGIQTARPETDPYVSLPAQGPELSRPATPTPTEQEPSTQPALIPAPEAGKRGDEITPPLDAPQSPARIVFLIDASGSLIDSMPQILSWVRGALKTVGPDERFAVIFFKAGRAIEIAPPGMLEPTGKLIDDVSNAWLNPQAAPVIPSGRSDPAAAITLAMGYKPTDLYFLSDEAFAYAASDTTARQAVDQVTAAIGDAAVRVHGVQFFYRNGKGALEALAERHGGTFEFVKEQVVGDGEPIDLLKELGGSN